MAHGHPEKVINFQEIKAGKDAEDIARHATQAADALSTFLAATDALVHEEIGQWMDFPELLADWELEIQEKLFRLTRGNPRKVTRAVVRHIYKQMKNGML